MLVSIRPFGLGLTSLSFNSLLCQLPLLSAAVEVHRPSVSCTTDRSVSVYMERLIELRQQKRRRRTATLAFQGSPSLHSGTLASSSDLGRSSIHVRRSTPSRPSPKDPDNSFSLSSEHLKKREETNDIRYRSIKASINEIRVADEDEREIRSGNGDEAHDGHLDGGVSSSPDVDER
jgi:hypothetical protein